MLMLTRTTIDTDVLSDSGMRGDNTPAFGNQEMISTTHLKSTTVNRNVVKCVGA